MFWLYILLPLCMYSQVLSFQTEYRQKSKNSHERECLISPESHTKVSKKSYTQRITLLQLPNDIICEVLNYLDMFPKKTWTSLRTSCKKLNDLLEKSNLLGTKLTKYYQKNIPLPTLAKFPSPLLYAIHKNYSVVFSSLIQMPQTNFKIIDEKGNTPLILLSYSLKKHEKYIDMILKKKDIGLWTENNKKQTALEIIIDRDHKKALHILQTQPLPLTNRQTLLTRLDEIHASYKYNLIYSSTFDICPLIMSMSNIVFYFLLPDGRNYCLHLDNQDTDCSLPCPVVDEKLTLGKYSFFIISGITLTTLLSTYIGTKICNRKSKREDHKKINDSNPIISKTNQILRSKKNVQKLLRYKLILYLGIFCYTLAFNIFNPSCKDYHSCPSVKDKFKPSDYICGSVFPTGGAMMYASSLMTGNIISGVIILGLIVAILKSYSPAQP